MRMKQCDQAHPTQGDCDGYLEMYKEVYCADGEFLVSPMNDVMNLFMSGCLVAQPDNKDMPFGVDVVRATLPFALTDRKSVV